MVKTETLTKIALFGSIGVAGSCLLMNYHMQVKHGKAPYTRKSFELLVNYPPAKQLLGDPIYQRRVDVFNDKEHFNSVNPDNTRLKVPVWGPKSAGMLYIWARRKYDYDDVDSLDEWKIRRLDLQIHQLDRRWKFYESEAVETESVEKDELKTTDVPSRPTATPSISDFPKASLDTSDPLFWLKNKTS